MKAIILLLLVASTLTYNLNLRLLKKNELTTDLLNIEKLNEPSAQNESFFFIGDKNGNISQYDKKTSQLVQTYDSQITGLTNIVSMARKGDKLIFSGNMLSDESKYSLNFLENGEVKFLGSYAGDNQLPLLVNNKSDLIFTGGDFGGNNARVKKWDLESGKIIKEAPWGYNYDIGMSGLAITRDDKWIFVGGEYGELMQMNAETMEFVHNYSKESTVNEDANVLSMFVTPDSKFLFMSNELGYVKQFDIERRKLEKDYGVVTAGTINKMLMSKSGEWFLTSDATNPYIDSKRAGSLKIFSIQYQYLMWDFGVIVESGIRDMIFSNEEQTEVLLLGVDKKLYTFSITDQKIVKDWGFVSHDEVSCIV